MLSSWQVARGLMESSMQEAQHFGTKVLQDLVRNRWGEMPPETQGAVAREALAFFERAAQSDAVPYPVRSMVAVLIAECVRQAGPQLWEQVVAEARAAASLPAADPTPSGMAVLVLRYCHEEITGAQATLGGEKKRLLLAALTASLDATVPLLRSVMEGQFVELSKGGGGRHEAALIEALQGAEQLAAWAPVGKMGQWNMIDAFAVMGRQGPPDVRMGAVECLRALAERRQKDEEAAGFGAVMAQVGRALMGCAEPLLASPAAVATMSPGGPEEEYGKRLCDSMALFGAAHLSSLPSRDLRMTFLQQMVLFGQSPSLSLASFSLPFWAATLRDIKTPFYGRCPERRREVLPDECLLAVCDLCCTRLSQLLDTHTRDPEGASVAEFDSEAEWHMFYAQLKNTLIAVVKQVASVPGVESAALDAVAGRFQEALGQVARAAQAGLPLPDNAAEAEVAALESVVAAVPGELQAPGSPAGRRLDALLEAVLEGPKPASPAVCVSLAQAVQVLARHQGSNSAAMGACFKYLLDLMQSLPGGGTSAPDPNAPAAAWWRPTFVARNKVVGAILGLCTASPASCLPFLGAIQQQTQGMFDAGRLTLGERNVLSEAMIAVCEGAEGGRAAEGQVIEWALAPVRDSWGSAAFERAMGSTASFLAAYGPVAGTPADPVVGGGQERWRLFHDVQLVERCLRRVRPERPMAPDAADLPGTMFDPMLEWVLERALALLRRVQGCWGAEGRAALGPAAGALDPSHLERLVLLGQQPSQMPTMQGKGSMQLDHGGTVGGTSVQALRSWLRGIREGAFQCVAVAAEHVPALYGSSRLAALVPEVLMEGLPDMETRHLRLALRHLVLPLMRHCPRPLRGRWIAPLLHPLVTAMERRLGELWAGLLPNLDGASTARGKEDADAASEEVVRERLVRDLTKDYASVLQAITGAGMVPGDPLASTEGPTVMEFLASASTEALGAHVRTCMMMLTLPDLDAATKALSCCRVVVGIAARNRQPGEFSDMVGGGMLRHCIQALTLPSNQTCHGEILSIIREILVGVGPHTRQHLATLSQLPGFGEGGAQALVAELAGASKEADQKLIIKKALASLGKDTLRALSDAQLVSERDRAGVKVGTVGGRSRPKVAALGAEDHQAEVAATEIFSVLFD